MVTRDVSFFSRRVIEAKEEENTTFSDIESGYLVEVSKEQREFDNQLMKSFMPKTDTEKFDSMPIIYGTAGDMEAGKGHGEMFFNPPTINEKDGE